MAKKAWLDSGPFVQGSGSIFVIFFATIIIFPFVAIWFISNMIFITLEEIFNNTFRFKILLFSAAIFAIFTLVHYADKMYKFHNGGFSDERLAKRGLTLHYKIDKEPSIFFPYFKLMD